LRDRASTVKVSIIERPDLTSRRSTGEWTSESKLKVNVSGSKSEPFEWRSLEVAEDWGPRETEIEREGWTVVVEREERVTCNEPRDIAD